LLEAAADAFGAASPTRSLAIRGPHSALAEGLKLKRGGLRKALQPGHDRTKFSLRSTYEKPTLMHGTAFDFRMKPGSRHK
jgi:hypothetical protein